MVLDQVQVLDQKVAPPRTLAQQRAHLVERPRVDLAALGCAARTAAARYWFVFDESHDIRPSDGRAPSRL
jgi:hypothetical protein